MRGLLLGAALVHQHGADLGLGHLLAVHHGLGPVFPDRRALVGELDVEVHLVTRHHGLAEAGLVDGHEEHQLAGVLVTQMVDPETDSLLLLYDDAQSIYRKSKGLVFSLSSVGIKASGRTSILRLNYRNTREIIHFACEFSSRVLDAKAADDDHIPVVLPETGGISGPGPAFRQFEHIGDEIAYATKCLKAWHERATSSGRLP